MSPSSESTIVLSADLHARPAGLLARTAAGFRSTVTVTSGGRAVDARSVLLVMSLGATKDTELTVRAEGDDAEMAVEALVAILSQVGDASTLATS